MPDGGSDEATLFEEDVFADDLSTADEPSTDLNHVGDGGICAQLDGDTAASDSISEPDTVLGVCGNTYCETQLESEISCPQDCANNPCGNQNCDPMENKDNCPVDCWTPSSARPIAETYHTKSTALNLWKSLCCTHPTYCSFEIVGESLLGKDIYLFKIGTETGGHVLFDGSIHGAEDCGTETELKFAEWILTSSEESAIHVRTKNYVLFVPIINMDSTRRQNMRREFTFDDSTQISILFGVDLNRNFPYGWGSSGSADPQNNYEYRGPLAGSEPETQAIRSVLVRYTPQAYLAVHCGGSPKMFGEGTNPTTNRYIVDSITSVAESMSLSTIADYHIALPSQTCSGGTAISEGCSLGASSWGIEVARWEDLPPTLEGYHQTFYPRMFSIMLGMCKAVEK